MRKIYFILAVGILAVVVFFVVFSSFSQQPTQEKRTLVFDNVQLRLETNRTTFNIGESVPIKVFQKNLRNEPVGPVVDQYQILVLNSTGDIVWKIGNALLWATDFRVMPMEEVDLGLPPIRGWEQIDEWGRQVPPGIYTIRFVFQAESLEAQITIVG
jgi:hypothetical protein